MLIYTTYYKYDALMPYTDLNLFSFDSIFDFSISNRSVRLN